MPKMKDSNLVIKNLKLVTGINKLVIDIAILGHHIHFLISLFLHFFHVSAFLLLGQPPSGILSCMCCISTRVCTCGTLKHVCSGLYRSKLK